MFLDMPWLAVLVVHLSLWVGIGVTAHDCGKDWMTTFTISGMSAIVKEQVFCHFSWVAPLLLVCCLFLPAVAGHFEADLSLVVAVLHVTHWHFYFDLESLAYQ